MSLGILNIFVISAAITVCIAIYASYTPPRSFDLERQDKSPSLGNYTLDDYVDLMKFLAELNAADPHGYNATLARFDDVTAPISDILEIGFGMGDFSILLVKKYPGAKIIGIDAHKLSVETAQSNLQRLTDAPSNVRFEHRSVVELNEPENSYDIITTTFVNHHIFPDEAFVDFLVRVRSVGRVAFIFNDLHRTSVCVAKTSLALTLVRYLDVDHIIARINELGSSSVLSQLLRVFRSRPGRSLAIDGGILSAKRAFTIPEYYDLFRQAGYPDNALQCTRLDDWWDVMTPSCRVTCVADLQWARKSSLQS